MPSAWLVVYPVILACAGPLAQAAQQQQQTPPPGIRRDAPVLQPASAEPSRPPLPVLTPEAQQLLDQLKQNQSSIIDQLRQLQLAYRDNGHAEDAAAIAAYIRPFIRRESPAAGPATAELVNEGLPPRDEPIRMTPFRGHTGETLSFAIRGRTDQSVWGTTTYTDDSGLETAAVHAGLLREGQTGIIKVRILAGQDKYDATQQNGISSGAYGRHDGSYRFVAVSVVKPSRTSSIASYRDLVGITITLPVIGATSGSVWGTDVYTDDSSVGAAAVHAGVLQPGEFGFVKITLLPGQTRYDASARNNIATQTFGPWEGSFRVESTAQPWLLQLPGGEDASPLVGFDALRGRTGLSFQVQVVGSATGTVWGTGPYTDDSSISAAAVHAGLLKPGELGILRVTVAEGQQSYAASERNGIKALVYGPWEGSFRLERVK